ncbi:MAG: dehydrogenase [Legionellales bacterium]|nr:dehydrogenase [Legionellales bacterium]|tara:strand:+ start:1227 stop:1934 length:708 start_codon:yes stop_codon:yes gene_type:complete
MKQKTALITGGTRGIGLAIAKTMHSHGFKVIITGTGEKSPGDLDFKYMPVDFSKSESLADFLGNLKELKVDVLVNNAGINMIAPYESIDEADFDQIQRVNIKAPFQIIQTVLPYMKNNKWGRVINIASIFGKISKAHRASYSASKFGLDGLTTALAVEVAEFGILANCVSPGFIHTDLTTKILGKEAIDKLEKEIPIKRLGQANEIAELVAFLCSEKNSYLTGQNIVIDGGFTRV